MQIVGKNCGVCQARVSNELESRVCRACDEVFHRKCVTGPCRHCGATVGRAEAAGAEHAAQSEAKAFEDDEGQRARGRRVLWTCFFAYLSISATLAVVLLLASGDVLRFGAAIVRWLVALEGVRRIARGSTLVAWIAIGLAAVGGIASFIIGTQAASIDRIVLGCTLGLAMSAIAMLLAMSKDFWAYVRLQKRLYDELREDGAR